MTTKTQNISANRHKTITNRKPLVTKISTKQVDTYTAEDWRSKAGEILKLFLVFWDHFTR